MTITYTFNVAEARLNGFLKLLLKWRGSIYKLLYREMIIFCAFFYAIHLLYLFVFNSQQKKLFKEISKYCDAFTSFIPLSFVLGFYVSMVVSRWWSQWRAIPWPDKIAMLVSGYIFGTEEETKHIKQALIRYTLCMQCLTFQAISTSVRKRFPSETNLLEEKFMTSEELKEYEAIDGSYGKWWLPAQWFTNLAIKAFKKGMIENELFLNQILNEMHSFRAGCGYLFAFDWVSIPLVYTQTVTIATYTYFGAKVIGRQFVDNSFLNNKVPEIAEIKVYIPVFTILEFFFFMGWLKVAEQLINPFGEDDDDFDCNWIIDRNNMIANLIINQLDQNYPDINKIYKTQELQKKVINTNLSRRNSINPHLGSTSNLNFKGSGHLRDSKFEKLQERAMSVCVPLQIHSEKQERKLSLNTEGSDVDQVLNYKPFQMHKVMNLNIAEETTEEVDQETNQKINCQDSISNDGNWKRKPSKNIQNNNVVSENTML